jgi:hypothetical protein
MNADKTFVRLLLCTSNDLLNVSRILQMYEGCNIKGHILAGSNILMKKGFSHAARGGQHIGRHF